MKTRDRIARTLTATVVALLLMLGSQAGAFAAPTDANNPFNDYTDSQLQELFAEAGVLPSDIPRVLAKVRAGEVPDALQDGAAPVSAETRVESGVNTTIYRFADGSATSFATASTGEGPTLSLGEKQPIARGGNVAYAVAVKGVGCKSKKTSGSKVVYTQCLVKAVYLVGTASFYFDGTRASGKFTIDRVYGGSCNYVTSCGSPKIQRKTSSSSQHALADMAVYGTPVKGVGWTQHVLVRVTNTGVMTAYGDYKYI